MTGAAIWDASTAGPELISLNMTSVMIVYSSLFCRWAFVVKPQNLLLSACHGSNVIAQCNQMRRAVEYKLSKGETEEVNELGQKAGIFGLGVAGLIAQTATYPLHVVRRRMQVQGAGLNKSVSKNIPSK